MDANKARRMVYNNNKLKYGVKEIDKLIEQACISGSFKMSSIVYGEWGSIHSLVDYYISKGFSCNYAYEQTSPNDSDDYIFISWAEK